MNHSFFYILIIVLQLFSYINAVPGYDVPFISAAPAGRGNTCTAVAHNSDSLNFNPAGIGLIYFREFSLLYNNSFNTGINNGYIYYAAPFLNYFNIGTGYAFNYFNDNELSYQVHKIVLGAARELFIPGLYIGGVMNTAITRAEYDNKQKYADTGFRLNLGIIYNRFDVFSARKINKILSPLSLGFYCTDLFNTYSVAPDAFGKKYTLQYNFGISYKFFNTILFETDLSRRSCNLGVQFNINRSLLKKIFNKNEIKFSKGPFSRVLALRSGIILPKQPYGTQTRITFGLGAYIFKFDLNYAFIYTRDLKTDHRFSLSYKFGFEEAFIKSTKCEVNNLFSSLAQGYNKKPVGYIELKNNLDKSLALEVGLYIKELMDAPTFKKFSIRPQSSQSIPLYAVFNDRIKKMENDKPLQAQIIYSYSYKKRVIKRKLLRSLLVYEKNAMTWDEPMQIAAFVTPKNKQVKAFARKAVNLNKNNISSFLPESLEKAMQIYNALQVYGINYVHDPNSAFSKEKENLIDSIQYPVETLQLKTGDCDDTSVLFCSLLESIAIPTAVIDIPGHIFMMFNTGVAAANAELVSADPGDYIIKEGQVWIAVETTLINKGFFRSWQEGMKEFNKWR
ncbi:MAG TPA: hypothetical protein VKS21_12285 [Spirochaetota bacterium]|nr:hypothetical protein [Spirochaetota bacterium]